MQLGGFNSVRFLAPEASWEDVVEGVPKSWQENLPYRGALFIALPDRLPALLTVQEACPGAEVGTTMGRRDQVLFYVYNLPPGTSCSVFEEMP